MTHESINLKVKQEIFKDSKLLYFLDSLVILINISSTLSVLPFMLFTGNSRLINTAIIFIINIIYFLLRFKFRLSIPKNNYLILLYILLNLYNSILALLSPTKSSLLPLAYLASNLAFYLLLFNLYNYYYKQKLQKSFLLVSRGYIWFAVFNVFAVVSSFVLMNLKSEPNLIEITNKYGLFTDNVSNGASYYFSYLSILLETPDIRIPFFQEKGILCGLFHEPHSMTFVIFPSIFLLLSNGKIFFKFIIVVLFILLLLIAGSTTNILAVLCCTIVYLLIKLKNGHYLKSVVFFTILIVTFIFISPENYEFISKRISSSGSMTYSRATIEFALTPKTIIGSDFYSYLEFVGSKYKSTTQDVGLIIFTLNVIFLITLTINIFKLLVSRTNEKVTIGLLSLYFLLHSMKIALPTYSFSLLIYVIFAIQVISIREKKENIIRS